jgi:Fur family ferric uptake transcriptional regulator/Fur family peroxide stress response transcriptional regulator
MILMTDSQTSFRLTPQRRAVFDVLRASHDHPTAREVFERVQRISPEIGPATVYRSLALLVESGQALELALGGGASARYDANIARHDHLVCAGCGRAVDIDTPVSARTVAGLEAESGFVVTGYDLQFRGVCADCRSAQSAVSRNQSNDHQ